MESRRNLSNAMQEECDKIVTDGQRFLQKESLTGVIRFAIVLATAVRQQESGTRDSPFLPHFRESREVIPLPPK